MGILQLERLYYRKSDCCILVYDATDKLSLDSL